MIPTSSNNEDGSLDHWIFFRHCCALVFLLASLFLIMTLSRGADASPPPSEGDWEIDGAVKIENQSVLLNGNLTVKNGGSLTLKNVTLTMNCSFDGQFNITMENGSSLTLLDLDGSKSTLEDMTEIRANASLGDHEYGFRAGSGSKLRMTGAKITDCGWEDLYNNRGLSLLTDDWLITESIFSGNKMGLFVNGSEGGALIDSNISGNSINGIFLLNSTNITIRGCNISGNDGHGVNLLDSRHNRILSNHMSGFSNDYVWWPANDGSGVWAERSDKNLISGNSVNAPRGARGIWLEHSDNNTVSNNDLYGNLELNYRVGFGLGLFDSDNNTVRNNTVDHFFEGIYIHNYSDYNKIENNFVNYSVAALSVGTPLYGLWVVHGECSYNYLANNTMSNSSFHGLLMLEESHHNYVVNNTFKNAEKRGQGGTLYGMLVDNSHFNVFENNHFINNVYAVGIGLQTGCEGNIIRNNSVGKDGTGQEAINLYGSSNGNIIENNTVYDREWSISAGGSSENNIIRNNTVYNCTYGITIWRSSDGNTVVGNRVNDTEIAGIYLFDWGEQKVYDNILKDNVIWNSTKGIYGTEDSMNTTLVNNTIRDSDIGIVFEESAGHVISKGRILRCDEGVRFNNVTNSSVGAIFGEIAETTVNLIGGRNITVGNSTFYNNTIGLSYKEGISRIHNSTFHNNTYGIKALDGGARIERSTFRHNDKALYFFGNGGARISDCDIAENDVGVYANNSRGITLERSVVSGNEDYGIYSSYRAKVVLKNGVLSSNPGRGVFCVEGGTVDLEVTRRSEIDNDRMSLKGNVTVRDGGILSIKDSKIAMGSEDDRTYLIEVLGGGVLRMEKSNLTSGTGYPYSLICRPGSSIEITDSGIEGAGMDEGEGREERKGRKRGRNPAPDSGIILEGCKATVTGSRIKHAPYGIYALNSTVSLEKVSLEDTEHWLYAVSSSFWVRNTVFNPISGVNVSMTFKDSQVLLDNCKLPDSDYKLIGKDNSTISLADTPADASFLKADMTSTITVKYGRLFRITDPAGSALAGVKFDVMNAKGALVYSGITDENGMTEVFRLVSFALHDGVTDDGYNPYTITLQIESPFGHPRHLFNVTGTEEDSVGVPLYPLISDPPEVDLPEDGSLVGAFNLNDLFSFDGELNFSYVPSEFVSVHIRPNGSVDLSAKIPDRFGTRTVTFVATNEFGLSSRITVIVKVYPVNDPPVIPRMESVRVEPDDTVVLNLTELITDVDTLFGEMNITVNTDLVRINGSELIIPYRETLREITVTLTVNDSMYVVNRSFTVYFVQRPYFSPLPDIEVELYITEVFYLSDHLDLSREDLVELVITTSSDHIDVRGLSLRLTYPIDVSSERVRVFYLLSNVVYVRTLNVTVSDHPEFDGPLAIFVVAGEESVLDLEEHISASDKVLDKLAISVDSDHAKVEGRTLVLLYPPDAGEDLLLVRYKIEGKEWVRTVKVTVVTPNRAPVIIEEYVTNVGRNYTFTVYGRDPDGQTLTARLVLNGNATIMPMVADTGVFRLSLVLSPGNYSYSFVLDDGTDAENSTVEGGAGSFEVAGKEERTEDLLNIYEKWPPWLRLLFMGVLLGIVVLLLWRRRKGGSILRGEECETAGPEAEMDRKALEFGAETEDLEGDVVEGNGREAEAVRYDDKSEDGDSEDDKGEDRDSEDDKSEDGDSEDDKSEDGENDRGRAESVKGYISDIPSAQRYDAAKSISYVMTGIKYSSRNDHAKSLEAFDRAISKNPVDPNPWYQKSIVYRELGKEEKAEECFERLIELDERMNELIREMAPPEEESPELPEPRLALPELSREEVEALPSLSPDVPPPKDAPRELPPPSSPDAGIDTEGGVVEPEDAAGDDTGGAAGGETDPLGSAEPLDMEGLPEAGSEREKVGESDGGSGDETAGVEREEERERRGDGEGEEEGGVEREEERELGGDGEGEEEARGSSEGKDGVEISEEKTGNNGEGDTTDPTPPSDPPPEDSTDELDELFDSL